MKQLFDKVVTARRFCLLLPAIGLFNLSISTYAAGVMAGRANSTESSIFASTCTSVLKKNHIEANTRLNLGNRRVIIPALQGGKINIVPGYLGALFNFYNGKTEATSQQDVSAELTQALLVDFTLLNPAPVISITAWAACAETAEKYHLRTPSDLEPVAPQLVIGGLPELAVRVLGLPRPKRVYGLGLKTVKSLDMGGPLTRLTLNSGKINVTAVVSTQGNLAKEKWVVLENDKHEQPSQNVVPLVRRASLTPEVGAVLNEVSGKLGNAMLIALGQQVDLQHKDPAAVAERWINVDLSQH